jgi:uncharacterized protein (DUF736 family)
VRRKNISPYCCSLVDGVYYGHQSAHSPFVASGTGNDKAPDYRIFAGATEFGAAWKKTARDSDREYLSVKLDDPSFPAPVYASLVRVEGEEDYSLIWSRRSGD